MGEHAVIVDDRAGVTACTACGLHVFARPGLGTLWALFAREHERTVMHRKDHDARDASYCGACATLEREE